MQSTLVDVEYYHDRKYKITQNTAVREEKKYDCCVEPYLNVLFTIGFQKNRKGKPVRNIDEKKWQRMLLVDKCTSFMERYMDIMIRNNWYLIFEIIKLNWLATRLCWTILECV